MKLTLNAGALAAALGAISGSVARRTEIPILKMVRLSVHAGEAVFAATNLDRESVYRLEAGRVETEGDIAVEAQALITLAGKLPKAGDVSLALDGAQLSIGCGHVRARLSTLPASDWPSLGGDEEALGAAVELTGKRLAETLGRVIPAVSKEATRHYLNGAWLARDPETPGWLDVVATDGHRMACDRLATPEAERWCDCIVPRDVLGEVVRLAESADMVEVSFWGSAEDPRLARFTAGPAALTTKLVDGRFPDWRRVRPRRDSGAPVLTLAASDLSEAAGLIVSMSDDRAPRAGVRPDGEGVLAWLDGERREASTVLAAQYDASAHAGSQGFLVNSRLLVDAMAAFGKAEIEIVQDGPASPIRIDAPSIEGFVHVLMPLRGTAG